MSTIQQYDDEHWVNKVLKDVADAGYMTNTLITTSATFSKEYGITAGAVALLTAMIHLLQWSGEQQRTAEDMWCTFLYPEDETNQYPEDIGSEFILGRLCGFIRQSIINEVTQWQRLGNTVIGVDLMATAIFNTMYEPGHDISIAHHYNTLIRSLDVKLVHTTTGEVHSTLKFEKYGDMIKYWDRLEGMMVALTLYPTISYQLTLNGAVLIPKYDSMVNVEVEDSFRGDYRILVLDANFTDHYINGQKWCNRPRVTEPGYSYIRFDNKTFIEGLLTLTQTIGVQQPWKELTSPSDY